MKEHKPESRCQGVLHFPSTIWHAVNLKFWNKLAGGRLKEGIKWPYSSVPKYKSLTKYESQRRIEVYVQYLEPQTGEGKPAFVQPLEESRVKEPILLHWHSISDGGAQKNVSCRLGEASQGRLSAPGLSLRYRGLPGGWRFHVQSCSLGTAQKRHTP